VPDKANPHLHLSKRQSSNIAPGCPPRLYCRSLILAETNFPFNPQTRKIYLSLRMGRL
jgi:hypothetical protein